MKTKTYLTSMVCLALLSACGGGGSKLTDGTKSAGLNACDPSSGPAGTSVTCTAPKDVDDCTFFFGKSPVDIALNDGAFSFKVSGLSGDKEMHFQCGAGDPISIGTFEVTGGSATGSDDVEPAGETTGGTTGEGGDVINPSGTTGGTTTGVEAPPPDSDGDGVPDTSDACPGTASGTTVDSTGCPPAAPTPTNAQISEFTVTKAKSTDNTTGTDPYFSTYKIHWNFSNAKAAYLAGNVFNRASTDSALSASDQCKMVGDAPYNRYLVTAADGRPINPNLDENASSDNVKKKYKYYLEGVVCGASGSSTECKSGSYSQNAIQPPKTYAFANDAMLKKDTYFHVDLSQIEKLQKNNLELQKDVTQYLPVQPMVNEVNPKCRMNLKKSDGTTIPTDTIFTISYVHYGSVCLAVQGNDDAWVVQCKSVTAPDAKIETSNATLVTAPKTALQVSYSYTNARVGASSVGGCVKTGGTWSDSTGAGSYSGTCEITDKTKDVNLLVTGMGEENSDNVKYHFEGNSPSLEFYWNGSSKTTPHMDTSDCDQSGLPTEDCSGKVDIGWKVTNHYQLSRTDADGTTTSMGSGDQPGLGAKEVRFYQGGDLHSTKTITSADDASGTIKLKRDHGHTTWKAQVFDTSSTKTDEKSLSWDYWTANADKDNPGTFFTMSDWEHLGCTADSYDDCCGGWDCDSECGVCAETEGPHMSGSMQWSGRHIKEVKSDCGMTIEQPSNDVYGYQHGKATGSWNNFDTTCNFTATAYDGTKFTWNNSNWTCCK